MTIQVGKTYKLKYALYDPMAQTQALVPAQDYVRVCGVLKDTDPVTARIEVQGTHRQFYVPLPSLEDAVMK